MKVDTVLRTVDLARAVDISVQQVRNYEAGGFIPPAERSASGYRRYTRQHLVALQTTRELVSGYGGQWAQQIMQAVHGGRLSQAVAFINERHADLDATRLQLEETLAALERLTTQLAHATPARAPSLRRVGAAARLAGVQVSALRFWEEQGLLQPVRESGSRYRLYDEQQLRRLRIVALLREANHPFDTIRATLAELETGQPQRALAAVEQRRSELTVTSWRCVGAMAALHAYINEFMKGLDADATWRHGVRRGV